MTPQPSRPQQPVFALALFLDSLHDHLRTVVHLPPKLDRGLLFTDVGVALVIAWLLGGAAPTFTFIGGVFGT